MKILVLSDTPWSVQNSFGNSFSNIFGGMESLEFANIYCRYGMPDNDLNMRCFQITEKSLIANLLDKNKPSGFEVKKEQAPLEQGELSAGEQKHFDSARKKRLQVMFWARDLIWDIGRWESKELKDFLDDFKPDIIFQPVYYSNYLSHVALFLKRYTGAPMVGYISDDNYTLRQINYSPLYWIDRLHKRKNVKRVIDKCEILYVISEIQRREYDAIFGPKCKILTKGEDFTKEPALKGHYSRPLKIVYAGNLGAGRWKNLGILASAAKKINEAEQKVSIEIYSGTPLTEPMKAALNIEGASKICPAVSYGEILEIQKNADVLVHTESFEKRHRLEVHQSFSTKLVDYMKLARPILAIGPMDVASIQHLDANKAAVVASSASAVYNALESLVQMSDEELDALAIAGYECGRAHHDIEGIHEMLEVDLNRIIDGSTVH